MLLHGIQYGKLMAREDALRLAAKEAAARERQRKPTAASTVTAATEITVHNARAVLLARINAVAERLRSQPARRNRLPRAANPPVVLPHVEDTTATAMPVVEPVVAVGVFVGRAASSELIDDREFAARWKESATTQNWRASIELNARTQQRRRGQWIG
jgi:hypothetical protein